MSYVDESKQSVVITDGNYRPQIFASVIHNVRSADSGVIKQNMSGEIETYKNKLREKRKGLTDSIERSSYDPSESTRHSSYHVNIYGITCNVEEIVETAGDFPEKD